MKLEVHRHCYIRGPRSRIVGQQDIEHSHEGGDQPHQHEDTGPAAYTIDKDEWRARTGLIGGGRKKYTRVPSGVRLPIVALEEWQRSFKIIVVPGKDDAREAAGPGVALPERLRLTFRMTVSSVEVVK